MAATDSAAIREAYDTWARLAPYEDRIPRRVVRWREHVINYVGREPTPDNEAKFEPTRETRTREIIEPAHWDGSCCDGEHFRKIGDGKFMQMIPLPDCEVCERERAWRNYIRLRDGLGVAANVYSERMAA